MKNHCLIIALILLAGCEDKNLSPITQGQAAQVLINTAPAPLVSHTTALTNQHMQENTTVYPRSSVEKALDQQLKAITAPIQQDLLDIMGTELQSVDTNFNGQRITFQYQVWQVKKQSVCNHVQQDTLQFSECTQAAKQLFQAMCTELQQEKQNYHPRTEQLQRMYCQATVEFKPTIAQISRSQPSGNNKVEVLRTACNDMIFKAKISENANDEKARDQACRAYKKAVKLN
ncbi:MAG TPA: hypothetical protein PLM98_11965 [Thiolinea sp.]|nr:hypothetical protein [Thiolinea sp.]